MEKMGQQGLTPETFRSEVMLQNATLNDGTIFSTIMIPSQGLFDVIPVDSDYPDGA